MKYSEITTTSTSSRARFFPATYPRAHSRVTVCPRRSTAARPAIAALRFCSPCQGSERRRVFRLPAPCAPDQPCAGSVTAGSFLFSRSTCQAGRLTLRHNQAARPLQAPAAHAPAKAQGFWPGRIAWHRLCARQAPPHTPHLSIFERQYWGAFASHVSQCSPVQRPRSYAGGRRCHSPNIRPAQVLVSSVSLPPVGT